MVGVVEPVAEASRKILMICFSLNGVPFHACFSFRQTNLSLGYLQGERPLPAEAKPPKGLR
jgi:hypothetical protein